MCTVTPNNKKELKLEIRQTMAELNKSIEKANDSICDSIFYYLKKTKK